MPNPDERNPDRPKTLQLRLFGTPQIVLDGAPLTSIKSAKARGLLYYLAVTQQGFTRLSLATLLWGELSETAARGNLRKALQPLRKYLGDYLVIERNYVVFDGSADYWVDAVEFERLLETASEGQAFPPLARAIDLYRGDFLDGFYLRGAPEFENWWLTQRARLREKMLDSLQTMSDNYAELGHWDQAIAQIRHYLSMEPWRESAHRHLMELLARNGQRSAALAQYEICRQILSDELDIEPARETVELYEQIHAEGIRPIEIGTQSPMPTPPQPVFPPHLAQSIKGDQPALFVGREQELGQLATILERSRSGQGEVVFITGDAGQGKTALMAAFARMALEKYPDLLVVQGNCNAFSGRDNPYLPFREVISQLSGDVKGAYSPSPLTHEQARRLWQSAPTLIQFLVDHSPYLVNTLVPGNALLERAEALSQDDVHWLNAMQGMIARFAAPASDLPQSALFDQCANLLRVVSNEMTLLILLDDLQWADQGSLHLLAHLGQRISETRICMVGAYRSEEVTLDRDGVHHPLTSVITDLIRRFGEVTIDLGDIVEQTGRMFVDAVLDAEPNQLDEGFRQRFYTRTQGHPLFTIELLRAMQDRNDLLYDIHQGWVAGPQLDWDHLPVRVDAVISERVIRLDERLKGVLSVASVEGETFTAQVVTQLEGLPERELFKALTQELVAQHRLVRESGEIQVGSRYLTRYRFTHALFQEYFYNNLGVGERRLLHGEVANALETIYNGQTERILAELAHHYTQGGWVEKALIYLHKAAQAADSSFAYDEASIYLNRELAMLVNNPNTPQVGEKIIDTKILLGLVHWRAGHANEAVAILEEALDIARELKSADGLARAVLEMDEIRWRFNLPAVHTKALIEEALQMMGEEKNPLVVRLRTSYARALLDSEPLERVQRMVDEDLALARRVGDPVALIATCYLWNYVFLQPKYIQRRLEIAIESLGYATRLGDLRLLTDSQAIYIINLAIVGDRVMFDKWVEEHVQLAQDIRQPFILHAATIFNTMRLILNGNFAAAEREAHEAQTFSQQMGIADVDGIYGVHMFTIRREQDRLREVTPILKMFVAKHSQAGVWQPGLALIYSDLGMETECRQVFENLAQDDFAELPHDALWVGCLAYLAEACSFLQDRARATTLYELLQPYTGLAIVMGAGVVSFGAADRFLGMLAAVKDDWDRAEGHFEQALAFNARLQAAPWLAHTQYNYAEMLLVRGLDDDLNRAQDLLDKALMGAQSMGMKMLERKSLALQDRIDNERSK